MVDADLRSSLRALSLLVPSTNGIAGFLRLTAMDAGLRHARFDWTVMWALAACLPLAWLAERQQARGQRPRA